MIRFIKYFLIWLCAVMVLACVAGYVYVRLEGKAFFECQFSKFFGQPSTIESVRYLVPFGVRFHDVEIRNVLEAEDVFLHLRFPFLLEQRFIIARLELIKPVFHLVYHEKGKVDFGGAYLAQQEQRFHGVSQSFRTIRGVLIDFLSVQEGRFEILDLAVEDPLKYEVGQINGKALKFMYPLEDQNIKFDVQGAVIDFAAKQWLKKSTFSASGWVNWAAKGMDVDLEFQAAAPVSGKAELKAKDNVLKITGLLNVGSDVLEEDGPNKAVSANFLSETLFEALQVTGSKLALNFNVTTKMDAFHLGAVDFKGDLNLSKEKNILDVLNPSLLFKGVKAEGS